jgi:hypothetical protein
MSINGKPTRRKAPTPPTIENAIDRLLGKGIGNDRKRFGSSEGDFE